MIAGLIDPATRGQVMTGCSFSMMHVFLQMLFSLSEDQVTDLMVDKTGIWPYRIFLGVFGAVAWLTATRRWPAPKEDPLCDGLRHSVQALFLVPLVPTASPSKAVSSPQSSRALVPVNSPALPTVTPKVAKKKSSHSLGCGTQ